MLKLAFIAVGVLLLAGCASNDPPLPGINQPDPEFDRECPDLPPVPANDGNHDVRSKHYAETRRLYYECKDNNAALRTYSRIVSNPSSKH